MRADKLQIAYEILFVLLLIACVLLNSERYEYLLRFTSPSLEKISVCALCFLIFAGLVTLKVGVFESIFLTCFRLASLYPIHIFYLFYSDRIELIFFSTAFYSILHLFFKIQIPVEFKSNKVFSKRFSVNFLVLTSVAFLAVLVANNGLPTFSALNLANIYDVRSAYNSSALIALFQSFVTFFVVPYLVFNANSFPRLMFPFLISFFVFLVSGGKFVFAMFIVFLVLRYIFKSGKYGHLPLIFTLPLALGVLLSFTNFDYMAHYVFFRPFVTPAWVSFEYFKFAEINGFFFYSEHFFTSIFSKTTHLPTSVGWQMFPESGTYANGGSIAYSYVNTGWLLFAEVGFIAATVKIISSIGKSAVVEKDKQFVMAILAFVGIYLGTTNIFTALKTRMLIVSIVSMFFFIKRKKLNE